MHCNTTFGWPGQRAGNARWPISKQGENFGLATGDLTHLSYSQSQFLCIRLGGPEGAKDLLLGHAFLLCARRTRRVVYMALRSFSKNLLASRLLSNSEACCRAIEQRALLHSSAAARRMVPDPLPPTRPAGSERSVWVEVDSGGGEAAGPACHWPGFSTSPPFPPYVHNLTPGPEGYEKPDLVDRFLSDEMLPRRERTRLWLHEVARDYERFPGDVGSTEVQVARLTERIKAVAEHMRMHRKDFSSRRCE